MNMNINDNSTFKQFAKGKKVVLKKGGRAVIYQRVSSKEQEEGFSPETQLERCYEWAATHGFEVVKPFEGEHESAKSDVNRKRFNEMLRFVKDKKNKIDAVIVYSTSRFSRTGTKSFSIVDELEAKGITVYSATSDYDARTPEGKMTQGLELLIANRTNTINSKAVRDNGAKALRDGRWIQQPPIGYEMKTTKAHQTITVNATGELIRMAFQMKADENLSNEEVRQRLSSMGLPLSKQRWSQIFHNIFYAGYYAHPFLEGDIIEGRQEPLVSLEVFAKVNGLTEQAHSRGYEVKTDKKYAPLLGTIKCPVCGHNLTASLSTKMRKRYGKEVGYYVCSRKHCKCNVSTNRVNKSFEEWINSASLPEEFSDVLELQLRKAFPILNKRNVEAVATIKTNLAHKESERERIENNIANASTPKIQDICMRQLEKVEHEIAAIQKELEEKNQEILNLDNYIVYGMSLRSNMLKLWRLSSLGHKHTIQNLLFPDGIVWSKENDDIEPLSKNEFLFTYGLKSGNYEQKESGQTADFSNLSALAPPVGLEPTTL